MQYQKDGQILTASEVQVRHPNVSFAATTFAELGYSKYVPPAVVPTLEEARASAIADVKRIRAIALERLTKNSGVAAIYEENIRAAESHQAGTGATTIMRDGAAATTFLTRFGAPLGMSADSFAAYVISENRGAEPKGGAIKAQEIETEYLRLAYGVLPGVSDADLLPGVLEGYRAYCEARA